MSALGLLLALAASWAPSGHVDARHHPSPEEGAAAFAVMERALVRGFDDICGDTFCEGDFGNLRAMQLRCSVDRAAGTVTACTWSFAGSYAFVLEGAGPAPVVESRTWACPLPVVPGTPLRLLLAALSGREALDTPLPGSRQSPYEALADCL